jgi:hypothetical protein
MFELHRSDNLVEVRVVGELPRAEGIRACAEAAAVPNVVGVLFDLREMTNAPGPGRGPMLADEIPLLLPGLRVAFVVRPNTVLYGVVRQITTLTKADLHMFDDRHIALAWLMEGAGPLADHLDEARPPHLDD